MLQKRKNISIAGLYVCPNSIFWVTTPQYCAYFTDCHYGFIIESPKGKSNPNIEKENKIFMEVFIMSKVVEFLQANPVQYLATVGRDGKAVFENNMEVKEICMQNPKKKGDKHYSLANFSIEALQLSI